MEKELQNYKSFYEKVFPISDDEFLQTMAITEFLELGKNKILVEEDKVDKYIYFLVEGIVRLYYIDEETTKETNVMFFHRTGIFTSYISYVREKPYRLRMETLTKTTLFRAPKSKVEALAASNQNINTMVRKVTEFLLLEMMEHYLNLLHLSKSKRYQLLEQEMGSRLIKKISVKHLSSFLGIEPESLSRIRRQIKAETKAAKK